MLLNHLFQWLLCFQHRSPLQSPTTTIHSPSTPDPLKGLCGLHMQIKYSGAYQLCSKKKIFKLISGSSCNCELITEQFSVFAFDLLIFVLSMSLCRKWWEREHVCIEKCVSALTQLVKCFHSLCLKEIVIIFVLLSPISVCPDQRYSQVRDFPHCSSVWQLLQWKTI